MQKKSFSIELALKTGWEIYKDNVSFFIGFGLLAGAIAYTPDVIRTIINFAATKAQNTSLDSVALFTFLAFSMSILGFITQSVVSVGALKIALNFVDEKEVTISQLFQKPQLVISYIINSLLVGLIILAGLILLIVPGIIWSIQLMFAANFIVDKNIGPTEAIRRSSQLTRGLKGELFLFNILLVLINIAGFLALGIGLFVTIPLSILADVSVYRQLLANSELASGSDGYIEKKFCTNCGNPLLENAEFCTNCGQKI